MNTVPIDQVVDSLLLQVQELNSRVETLEARLNKPKKKRAKQELQPTDELIRDAILNKEHPFFNADLLTSARILMAMRDLHPDNLLFSFNELSERSLNSTARSLSRRLSRIPEFESMPTSQYVPNEDGVDAKQYNSTVWCVRNHDKYRHMSSGARYTEAQSQGRAAYYEWEAAKARTEESPSFL